MCPLVSELATDGIPVVDGRRAGSSSLPASPTTYRWLARPVTARDPDEAYLANAVFDAPPR